MRVREDERFIRDGEDLHTVVDVRRAAGRARHHGRRCRGIDGEVPLEIPAGTQPGEVSRCARRGMPPLQRGRTGDLHVHVNVVIPRKLSREQRDLLHQLADSLTDGNLGEERACSPSSSARWRGDERRAARAARDPGPARAGGGRARGAAAAAARRGGGDEPAPGEVEYATYARRAELPRERDMRALAGDAVLDVTLTDVPAGWETRWHEYLGPSRSARLRVRPPWLDGERRATS